MAEGLLIASAAAGCPTGGEDDGDELEELAGYSAAYAKLANASKADKPVLPEIADTRQYVDAMLAGILGAR
jgi:exportin-2 (importin alpha re-exporter)